MNELTGRLNDLGSELDPAGREARAAVTYADALVNATIAQERSARAGHRQPPQPRDPRRARRWMLTAVIAGCLAVAIIALVAALPNHEGAPTSIAPAPASAAIVLRRVADHALRMPAAPHLGPHQFLYLKELEGQAVGTPFRANDRKTAVVMVLESAVKQDWVATDGSGRESITATTTRFYTARDRAIARQAGLSPPPNMSSDGRYPSGGIAYDNPVGLPLGPHRLLHTITNRFWHGRFNLGATFYTVSQLLQDSQSAALRAALYQVVAQLQGIELIGHRRDALGRLGIAVADPVRTDGTRDELIFDPTSSQLLQFASVQATPSHSKAPTNAPPITVVPIGSVLNYTTYITSRVVNSVTELPGGAHQPVHPGTTG